MRRPPCVKSSERGPPPGGISHGDLGTIRIGFTSAASLNPLVPAAISSFRNAYPDVELRLVVHPTTPLLAQLCAGCDRRGVRPSDADGA